MSQSHYYGARWVRADFHLHSPGAYSFRFPDGLSQKDRNELIRRYVDQLQAQGIEIAAITDYQHVRVEWFVPIRDAAAHKGIYIYPGVELSFGGGVAGKHGLHVLAIFPYQANPESINRAIDKLLDDDTTELLLDDGRHRDLKPQAPIRECLPRLRQEQDCLFIFAHPHDSHGLFKTYSPVEAADVLRSLSPEAIESFDEDDRQRLHSTGKVTLEYLRTIAGIENSDNHSIAEIGTKAHDGRLRRTYLKLSAPDDLRAIRLALRDNALLVRVGDPPAPDYTRLLRLTVEGSGFLGGVDLTFSPELNVLVGGRGVGKSAILETVRFVLDLEAFSPTEYRERLVEHALGSGGKAILTLCQAVRPGVEREFRIERVLGEAPRVFEGERAVQLLPREVLGEREIPLFFGQREMYEVTQVPALRRRLLDAIIGRESDQQRRQVKKLEEEARRNMRAILERQERLAQREDLEKRWQEIEHQVALYRQYGIAQKLQEATALTRDAERLRQAREQFDQARSDWHEFRQRLSERWASALSRLGQAGSAQAALLQEAARLVRHLRETLDGSLQQGETSLQQALTEFDRLLERWEQERRPLDEAIQRLKQELGMQLPDPDVLIRLTQEQETLRPQLDLLRREEAAIVALQQERRQKLGDLREQRRQVFQLRQKQAEAISQALRDRVTVQVKCRSQRKDFAEALIAFFSGSGLDKETLHRVAERATDGLELAEWIRQGEESLVNEANLTLSRARQMIRFVEQSPPRIYDLELLTPEDEVEVALRVNETWLPLEKLSAGQRAAAMLLILLTRHDRLLLADQPEDDLDNRFIFDDVVPLLREQKGRRQIIVATHNPNIPVLGHAELVVALEARDDRASPRVQGAIDRHDVQDIVRNIMEGGDEAFRRRAEKYGVNLEGGRT
ncbi:TrlF family AAA-like ATPase [Roseiflexus sp. RS-1]|jgi:DNA repair ATPase RecN|uniref:TrlF family AAA-like ATPase n=1 Tax=Roseiflexus sp. (strain RS-1) TaxID=357808 RepID=UPI0000D7FB1A|nr:AAA family ATPase [Roseiflexus sp. RS-1]ABQ90124.1 SMC domain protein [Roseiflexus sp. RS-1]